MVPVLALPLLLASIDPRNKKEMVTPTLTRTRTLTLTLPASPNPSPNQVLAADDQNLAARADLGLSKE